MLLIIYIVYVNINVLLLVFFNVTDITMLVNTSVSRVVVLNNGILLYLHFTTKLLITLKIVIVHVLICVCLLT